MTEDREIEVEIIEVESRQPANQPSVESTKPQSTRTWGQMPQRVFRLPKWLLPVLILVGIVVILIALVLFILIGIPLLIIRSILRLLR